MRISDNKTMTLLACLGLFALLSGCTNWEQKYDALSVEHENLKGQLVFERGQKRDLADRISSDQQTIDELRRQIEEKKKTPAEASGFGEGYDVAFNAAAGTITVTLPNAILFDSGKAELKKATSTELDHIRTVLKDKYPNKQIDVVGHTDTDPINKTKDLWKDNWELSAERALAVTRYLIARGIDEKMICAVACGETRPIVSNATASGKARNRRVEIVVHVR
jgi:chemotaxis protein MotB